MRAFAEIVANGTALQSDLTTTTQLGGVDLNQRIEVVSFYQENNRPPQVGGTHATGRLDAGPITLVKRVDRTSPLLAQALMQNQAITGNVRFFAKTSSGADVHYFTYVFSNARIASVRAELPNAAVMGSSDFLERVSIAAQTLELVHEQSGTEFQFTPNSQV